MKNIIINSKEQIISVAHIREFVISENTFDECFDLTGIYTNGDEVFIDSYPSREEAREAVETICGEVYELSHEPQVLTPDPETANNFEKVFEEPGVTEEDIPEEILERTEQAQDNTDFGIPYDELMNEISKEEDENDGE